MIQFQIPDEALDQLRSLLEDEGKYQWEIGQFISSYWEEMLRYVHPEEVKEQHAEMIRQFARGTQADKTTLRDRENMWNFFTDEDRIEFEEYTYHWFRAVKSAGRNDWRKYAELAVENDWSIAQIRRQIKKDKDPAAELLKRIEKIEKAVRKILDDKEVPEKIRESLSLIPTIIEDTKELL